MQMIGAGALGPQAAGAIRHVAVQNGVWSLGNFGGVPPRSAMGFYNNVSSIILAPFLSFIHSAYCRKCSNVRMSIFYRMIGIE